MPSKSKSSVLKYRDKFPTSSARDAIVSVVRAYGIVQKVMAPHFAKFELTPPQFQLLTIVNQLWKPTQRQLARELYVSFPNVTVMLDRLEKTGVILRSQNMDDKRAKFIELSKLGRSLLKKIWKVHQKQLYLVMVGLTEKEQKVLTHYLNKMIAAHVDKTY